MENDGANRKQLQRCALAIQQLAHESRGARRNSPHRATAVPLVWIRVRGATRRSEVFHLTGSSALRARWPSWRADPR